MFFDSPVELLRVAVVGLVAYASLVALLRLSGKRTLGKLNAFDLVVTVALGSTLATVLLSKDVALLEGVLALALLITGQFVVAWLVSRYEGVARAVKAEAVVLAWHGQLLHDELRRQRVAPAEVRQALRQSGVGSLAAVAAVVLETDGSISVLTSVAEGPSSTLIGVRNRAAGRNGGEP
jgi:uncharacterized membrane protein YcaP (DUF421 family)